MYRVQLIQVTIKGMVSYNSVLQKIFNNAGSYYTDIVSVDHGKAIAARIAAVQATPGPDRINAGETSKVNQTYPEIWKVPETFNSVTSMTAFGVQTFSDSLVEKYSSQNDAIQLSTRNELDTRPDITNLNFSVVSTFTLRSYTLMNLSIIQYFKSHSNYSVPSPRNGIDPHCLFMLLTMASYTKLVATALQNPLANIRDLMPNSILNENIILPPLLYEAWAARVSQTTETVVQKIPVASGNGDMFYEYQKSVSVQKLLDPAMHDFGTDIGIDSIVRAYKMAYPDVDTTFVDGLIRYVLSQRGEIHIGKFQAMYPDMVSNVSRDITGIFKGIQFTYFTDPLTSAPACDTSLLATISIANTCISDAGLPWKKFSPTNYERDDFSMSEIYLAGTLEMHNGQITPRVVKGYPKVELSFIPAIYGIVHVNRNQPTIGNFFDSQYTTSPLPATTDRRWGKYVSAATIGIEIPYSISGYTELVVPQERRMAYDLAMKYTVGVHSLYNNANNFDPKSYNAGSRSLDIKQDMNLSTLFLSYESSNYTSPQKMFSDLGSQSRERLSFGQLKPKFGHKITASTLAEDTQLRALVQANSFSGQEVVRNLNPCEILNVLVTLSPPVNDKGGKSGKILAAASFMSERVVKTAMKAVGNEKKVIPNSGQVVKFLPIELSELTENIVPPIFIDCSGELSDSYKEFEFKDEFTRQVDDGNAYRNKLEYLKPFEIDVNKLSKHQITHVQSRILLLYNCGLLYGRIIRIRSTLILGKLPRPKYPYVLLSNHDFNKKKGKMDLAKIIELSKNNNSS